MIIDRFGDTYSTAYIFSRHNVADDYTTTRSPVAAQVGGMSGAFDFYGTDNYPVQPLTIRKNFSVTSIDTFVGTGTANMGFASINVTGTGTRFLSEVQVGDYIIFSDTGQRGKVTVVTSDTALEVESYVVSGAGSYAYSIQPWHATALGVEIAINKLRKETIAQGEQKLWAIGRDGVKRFIRAKCVSLNTAESVGNVYGTPATIEFFCREGVWYSESATTTSFTQATSYPLSVPTIGNYVSPVAFTITPTNGTLTSATVTNATNGYTFTWVGTVADDKSLILNSYAYTVKNDGTGAYSGLTIGANQVNWFLLDPGANAVTVTVNASGGGTATTWTGSFSRSDKYL